MPSHWEYVTAAYAIWGFVFAAYVLWLVRRSRAVRKQAERLADSA
jgi:heme exporter protein CcmD